VRGAGVGGEFPDEFTAAGVPLNERGARLDETLSVLPDLLSGRPVDHIGATLQLRVAALEPTISTLPRVFIGGRGDAALRRAARFGDVWLPMWLGPEELAERAARLSELAAAQQRARPGLALLVGVHVDDDLERAREEAATYLNGQYRLPLRVVEHWSALGSIEHVLEQLHSYVASGVEEFVLMPLARDPLRQYERLAEISARLRAQAPGADR
jgi:alkanesulfonate monooxygenase SsuD/methylene tetrahydromethanopterin reductase-like flavin-dependent oxidoreductase (luciferase family)